MQDKILKILSDIMQSQNIKILYAVESGSRAWGFSSENSDYDIRFIYMRPVEDYLRIDSLKDTIEYKPDNIIDASGWDLKKALGLLGKSNPSFFEWHNSPIIYMTTELWQNISPQFNDFFEAESGFYHYYHMAENNYKPILEGNKKLKKYFYVLRCLLACKWITDKKTSPPVLFDTLINEMLEDNLKDSIKELIEIKKNSKECVHIEKTDWLDKYIQDNFAYLKEAAPKSHNFDDTNKIKRLNDMFINSLEIKKLLN